MLLRIDPAVPLVWRSPAVLQLGGLRPLVVLDDPGEFERSVIALLRRGVTATTLQTIGEAIGGRPDALRVLLRRLAPALETGDGTALSADAEHLLEAGVPLDAPPVGRAPAAEPEERSAQASTAAEASAAPIATRTRRRRIVPAVLVDGEPTLARAVATAVAALGHRIVGAAATPAEPIAVAVLTANWVISPGAHLTWLRRDVPHLAVVHEGGAVRLGPFVEPGAGGCLRCIELHRRDADASWPVIAAQLAVTSAQPLEPAVLALVAAHAAALVDERIRRGATALAEASVSVSLAPRLPESERHAPHPECGCRALGGIATAPARPDASRPGAPSSSTGVAVPA